MIAGRGCCVAAVARVMVLLAAMGRPPCSSATGAYCKARAKLPEKFLQRLTYEVGTELEDQAPAAWRWHNCRTLLLNGSESTLPVPRRINGAIRNLPPNGPDSASR